MKRPKSTELLFDRVVAVDAPKGFNKWFEQDPEGPEIQDFLRKALQAAVETEQSAIQQRETHKAISKRKKAAKRATPLRKKPVLKRKKVPAVKKRS